MDDMLALIGLCLVLGGIYLWLGLAATLIVAGLIFIWVAVRMEGGSGTDKETSTNRT